MLRPACAAAMLCLVVSAAGCSRDRDPATPVVNPQAPWCAEHGVPESACTICHPELAAAFQAKGDWCAEHGLPESVCPACRGEASDRTDGPPSDGTLVRLRGEGTPERVGITTVPAEPAPRTAAEIDAPARIVANPRGIARVHAPLPGVVREVLAAPGDVVARGQVLARIDSAEVGAASAALRAARSRLDTAGADYERARSLHGEGVIAQADLLAAKRDRDQAEADLAAARAELGIAGADAGDDPRGRYDLRAPIRGVVVRVDASAGRASDTEDPLFELVDPAEVVVEIDVAEGDLPLVRKGAHARLEIAAFPGRRWDGSIASIAPELDPATRTAVARMVLANADGALRPGSWGRARIDLAGPAASAWVPRGAVQRARGVAVVFVESRPGLYETRHVAVARTSEGRVLLARGVRPGESVVVDGAFLLKTETLRDAIGAGCCE